MNAPDRFERFVLPDGVNKVTVTPDTKVKNAATFRIEREDHTVGNTVTLQLHRDPEVLFAGYKVPHPLEYHTVLRVQTKGTRDKKGKTPQQAYKDALSALESEFQDMHNQFNLATQQGPENGAPLQQPP